MYILNSKNRIKTYQHEHNLKCYITLPIAMHHLEIEPHRLLMKQAPERMHLDFAAKVKAE